MKSSIIRRKHFDIDDALDAMSDPSVPARDAVLMWRKALRRANGQTKELLGKARLRSKKVVFPVLVPLPK
jgi:hypothetical protein